MAIATAFSFYLIVFLHLEVVLAQNYLYSHTNSNCANNGFRCDRNSNCKPRSSFCNGVSDCSNLQDENYCDDYITQFNNGCPSNWWKCDDGRCIPSNWKCNGLVDCRDASDENTCSYLKKRSVVLVTTEAQAVPTVATRSPREDVLGDKLAKWKLLNWFVGLRKNGTETNKWGHDLPRIAIALFLADQDFFTPGNRTMDEMNYELTIQLLSEMAGGGALRRRDLPLYIHALMVACVDPRNFHGRDLVSDLRSAVESGNGTVSPFELLVLCNAGDAMSDKDVERVAEIFDSQHRPFWTDNQAMATMALACVSGQPGVTVDERTLLDMAQELKKRQFRNGTVDNLKTTALVVQALIATQSFERDFDLDAAVRVLLRAQREDGSVGSFLDSYYVLPVLSNSSLLNVTSGHCMRPTSSESEALSELRGLRGSRVSTQFSVWIGTEVDLKRTWTLKVPVNSTLYGILETVQKLDTRQRVEYNVIDGKPYVSSLMGIQDDVETGFYWFTYLRTQGKEDSKLVENSPVDVKIRANQELILWYKSGQWNKPAEPESLL